MTNSMNTKRIGHLRARIVRTGVALTVLLALTPVGRLMAQEEGEQKRVAVFVLPASESDARSALLLSRVLRENIKGLTGVELVTPAPVQSLQLLPQVKADIERAYQLLNGKQVAGAMEILKKVRPTLEQVLPAVDVRTLALYYKAFGVAQMLSQNPSEARKAVEISLILWPEQTNLEYAYSVEMVKLFNEVYATVANRRSRKLKIVTEPENAVVVVDGREATQSPAVVTNLVAGPHVVRIAMDGYEQWASFETVKDQGDNVLNVQLSPIPQKAEFDMKLVAVSRTMKKTPEEATPNLVALKEFLGAHELIVLEGTMLGENFELKGFHIKQDGSVFPVNRALPRDATLMASIREFLSGLVESFYDIAQKTEGLGGPPIDPVILEQSGIAVDQGTSVFDPDNPVFPTVDRKGKKKGGIWTKWWFWTGVGVIVAGGATAAALLLLNTDDASGPSGTIQINLNPVD